MFYIKTNLNQDLLAVHAIALTHERILQPRFNFEKQHMQNP